MPRLSAHLVKSAIRLERQSTTVPNTSNTRAFTPEISDMSTPSCLLFLIDGTRSKHLAILHEPRGIGDLIVKDARLRIGGLRQPVHPAGACGPRFLVHGLDHRPPQPESTRAFQDKQILQVTVIPRRP